MRDAPSTRTLILLLATVLPLAGFAADGRTNPLSGSEIFLNAMGVTIAENRTVTTCYGHGCARRAEVRLDDSEWREVRSLFAAPAADASEERTRLANAVALLERIVGETVNTTVYLSLIEDDGLLAWHTLGPPADRNLFTGACCWPHKTAVVTETSDGTSFAIDSWFHDNGVPAEVVPLSDWLSGWRPPGDTGPTS